MNAFNNFCRIQAAMAGKEMSTGHVLLDRAFKIPLKSSLLVRYEPQAGATAILLDLAATLTKAGKMVIFFDLKETVYTHRITDIDTDLFLTPKVVSYIDIMDIVSSVKEVGIEDPVFIFDDLRMLDLDKSKRLILNLPTDIRSLISGATVISSQRKGGTHPVWTYVIELKNVGNEYAENEKGSSELKGHILEVKGVHGVSKVFIEYKTGRISRAYEHVVLEMEQGKSANSIFELDGIRVQGSKKFIHEYNRKLKNGI